MTKTILTAAMVSALFLTSCTETAKQENTEVTTSTDTVVTEPVSTDVIKTTSTSKDGKTLDLAVDPATGMATVNFNGETIEMKQEKAASGTWYTDGTVKAYLNGGDQIDLKEEKAASGIWYKNDQYELSGKGKITSLKKTVQ